MKFNWKRFALDMAINYAAKDVPEVAKVARVYEKYGRYKEPLKQAVKDYKTNRKTGVPTAQAIVLAAEENDVSKEMLGEVLARLSPELGAIALGSVLEGTVYGSSKPKKK